jgi:hypothetical protein
VIQHLTGKEVLDLFTVSLKCYQLISESPAALKKIQFCFRERSSENPSRSEVTAMLESDRKYQNMSADFRLLANAGRKLLLLERFSQSLVALKILIVKQELLNKLPLSLSFPKLKSLDVTAPAQIVVKLLEAASEAQTLSDSLVHLKIFIVGHDLVGKPPPSSSFPKLKSLDVRASAQINAKLLQTAGNLEILRIETYEMDDEVIATVMKLESLKELKLRGNRDDFFSKHSMKDAKFKLKALFTEDYRYISKQARINFDVFVLQSAETLKSFNVWSYEDINLAFNKLPALEHLYIDASLVRDMEDMSKLQLKPNETIKTLKCRTIPKNTEFLACLTNLEILTAQHIRKEDFEWIVRNMPTLKELRINFYQSYEKEAADDVKTFYEELKNSESSINRNIEIVIVYPLY